MEGSLVVRGKLTLTNYRAVFQAYQGEDFQVCVQVPLATIRRLEKEFKDQDLVLLRCKVRKQPIKKHL